MWVQWVYICLKTSSSLKQTFYSLKVKEKRMGIIYYILYNIGRRLYQYNEEHFYIGFDVDKLFSNYKSTSNQREVF